MYHVITPINIIITLKILKIIAFGMLFRPLFIILVSGHSIALFFDSCDIGLDLYYFNCGCVFRSCTDSVKLL